MLRADGTYWEYQSQLFSVASAARPSHLFRNSDQFVVTYVGGGEEVFYTGISSSPFFGFFRKNSDVVSYELDVLEATSNLDSPGSSYINFWNLVDEVSNVTVTQAPTTSPPSSTVTTPAPSQAPSTPLVQQQGGAVGEEPVARRNLYIGEGRTNSGPGRELVANEPERPDDYDWDNVFVLQGKFVFTCNAALVGITKFASRLLLHLIHVFLLQRLFR